MTAVALDAASPRAIADSSCPHCGVTDPRRWAEERGYVVARCGACGFLYLNPMPAPENVDVAVRTGMHTDAEGKLDVRGARMAKKVTLYERVFGDLFSDVWRQGTPIHWLDVGAGYGEVVEAVGRLAPSGSTVEGVEPMVAKAKDAAARGLTMTNDYLRRDHAKVDIVSSIDVFSHIPDYRSFVDDVRSVLKPHGEFVIETGNVADLNRRDQFPFELGLPDHLAFAGKRHITAMLEQAGFEIVAITERRVDDLVNLAKSLVKLTIGRPAVLGIPYRSQYRQLIVRARLRG